MPHCIASQDSQTEVSIELKAKIFFRCFVVIFVQSLSHVRFFATQWTAALCTLLSSTLLQSLLKCICIESVVLSNHLIICHPLLLLLSIFPIIRVFSNKWALGNRWPSYWSFSISTSDEHSGLISFSIDWFDFLAVQRTLGSPLFLGAFL